jgi:hypothetical protein
METKSWRTMDKSDWGDGPWQDEPDKMQWQDEASGLPCLAKRATQSGSWCGYVGVSEGHPWFEMNPFKIGADVHGGLNFATFCQDTTDESQGICHIPSPGEPDHVYWIGFDCGHAWDQKPGNDALLRRIAPHLEEMRQQFASDFPVILGEVYRDLAYVRDQCRLLAGQVEEAHNRSRT